MSLDQNNQEGGQPYALTPPTTITYWSKTPAYRSALSLHNPDNDPPEYMKRMPYPLRLKYKYDISLDKEKRQIRLVQLLPYGKDNR
jgi:hypothetical protein